MRVWEKMAIAALAPLLATGCLWSPGKFTSELALRKNGTYTLDYKGEILLQMPSEESKSIPWGDDFARCYTDGRAELMPGVFPNAATPSEMEELERNKDKVRPCNAAEIASVKSQYEKEKAEKATAKREESEQMSKVFGLPGSDDVANRKFAATLMKYKGWRSVAYQGKGMYLVEYHAEGALTQDVVFPMIPNSDLILPFIAMRRRADGSVMVSAPAFTGGSGPFGARAKMMGLPDKSDGPQSRAVGRFTIVTDGEILTNNSEDGAAPHARGRQLRWDVDAASAKVPEALVKL
jgi:hypothetical protein